MFSTCLSRLGLVTAVGAVVLAVSAPGASAATSRYVAPGGYGNCSSAKPCNLEDAVKASVAGDEVIAKPGDYHLFNGLQMPAGITVRGVAGQPRPRLIPENGALWLLGTTLRYVEVQQTNPTISAISAENSTLDQLFVRGPSFGDCAVSIDNSTLRDSVVIARSTDGSAICADALQSSNTTHIRNVTAVAHEGWTIETCAIDSTANVSMTVVNTIAKADATGVGLAVCGALGAHAKMTVSHTNYSKYGRSGDLGTAFVDAGHNQGTAPLFVDPAKDDYRQKAGSVTIDAGADDALNGPLDLDGDPRKTGTTDIGADEFVPPPPPPPPSDPTPPTTPVGGGGGGTATGGFAGVKLISTALTLKRGLVTVKLSCPAATAGPCTGVTRLTARRKRAGASAATTVKLGRVRFSIAPGGQKQLKVRVSRAGKRLFAHKRRLRGRAASAAHDAAGLSRTTVSRVTIRKGTR